MSMNDSKPKRRWYQFSLRTLLVFVLLCSIFCSWFAVKMNRARKQKEAVEAIVKWRAWVHYDYEYDENEKWIFDAEPATPAWIRNLLGDDFLYDVVEVGIDPTQVPDEAVKKFQEALPNCDVVDEVYP